MLRELLESKELEDINNFLENEINIKNSLCIRVPKDRAIDIEIDLFMAEATRDMEFLGIEKWFKERLQYCEKLNQKNKEVSIVGIGARAILSVVEQCVIFNYDTMTSKIEKYYEKTKKTLTIDEVIRASINDYMTILKAEKSAINVRIDEILKVMSGIKLKGKKIIILLEDEIENYKINYDKYLSSKLFNNNAGTYSMNGKEYGRYDGFANLNDDKYLLKRVGAKVEETNLYTTEEAKNLMNLGKYLYNKARTRNTFHFDDVSLELKFDPKEKKILDYECLPYEELNELRDNPIYIDDVIGIGIKTIIIENYSFLMDVLDSLVGYAISKGSKIDTKKKELNIRYKKIIKRVDIRINDDKEKIFYSINKEAFLRNLERLLKDIVDYNSLQKVTGSDINSKIFNMARIINLRICLEAYFHKDGGSVLVRNIMEKSYEKILDFKKTEYIIEGDDELLFMAGQLGKYLVSKSKAAKKNRLLTSYHKAMTMDKINLLLQNDMEKYSYDVNMYSRASCIFAEILKSQKEGKLTPKERKIFLVGLYGENLIYKAISESAKANANNENQGNGEVVKSNEKK